MQISTKFNVGDSVFWLRRSPQGYTGEIEQGTVSRVKIEDAGRGPEIRYAVPYPFKTVDGSGINSGFGGGFEADVFATRAEAEQALTARGVAIQEPV